MTQTDSNRILLLSTSTIFGSGYLEYARDELCDFLGDVETILFVPFALHDRDSYAEKTAAQFAKMGFKLNSLHRAPEMKQAVDEAEAIFIGGGNTFRLLKTLYDFDLLTGIRKRVKNGMQYMGASAGSNVAGPTICTTNDMPIVQPPSFEALGLVPFQINPHYVDAEPASKHMGETREERILQFLEENDKVVIGLREGAIIRVENGATRLRGVGGARLFRRGQNPTELAAGDEIRDISPERGG
jgi:dipeptidase E